MLIFLRIVVIVINQCRAYINLVSTDSRACLTGHNTSITVLGGLNNPRRNVRNAGGQLNNYVFIALAADLFYDAMVDDNNFVVNYLIPINAKAFF